MSEKLRTEVTRIEMRIVQMYREVQANGYGELRVSVQAGKVTNAASTFTADPKDLKAMQDEQ